MIELEWHGPEPTDEWRERAVEEALELEEDGLSKAEDLVFHDVWDDSPDDRPRIFMYGKDGDNRIHVDFITVETDPLDASPESAGK